MKIKKKNENGHSTIFALILSVILSSTVLIISIYQSIQQKFVNRKYNFLRAKYCAQGGMNIKISEMEKEPSTHGWFYGDDRTLHLSSWDSCQIITEPWGGFLHLVSRASRYDQSYSLQAILGLASSKFYFPAIVINPKYPTLVISGNTRISGDIRTGPAGLRRGSLPGIPDPGKSSLSGRIKKALTDYRPQINRLYISQLFNNWKKYYNRPAHNFSDLISGEGNLIDLPAKTGEKMPLITVGHDVLNLKNWQIKGPAVLITEEKLTINCELRIKNFVQILGQGSIILAGNCIFTDVIVYSPASIQVKDIGKFEGQIFSEKEIIFSENMHVEYPGLFLVYSSDSEGSLRIDSNSEVTGWFFYVEQDPEKKSGIVRPNILISENSIVNGLVYCDRSSSLQGKVNGIIISDHFLLEKSPAKYYNWIFSGQVNRNDFMEAFTLPIFMKMQKFQLIPLCFR
jgi:cytoskeletal protein CcmA (bactofilin family)